MIKTTSILLISFFHLISFGQEKVFPNSPMLAEFVTSDIDNFWIAYDSISLSESNPFDRYLNKGSLGLKGFISHRIVSADKLLEFVIKHKELFEKKRGIKQKIKQKEKETIPYFYALEYWYPYAVYPPIYFVYGRNNSGGTVSDDGLIIGVEKLNNLDDLPNLVIHESIHFQQILPKGDGTLLQNSILEGTADFIAELVTGNLGNITAHNYGNAHEDKLCKEFVVIMDGEELNDWLYGVSGKDDRPNDLGYWIGYKIVQAFFDKKNDKKLAVNQMLNIVDYNHFLNESGYLDSYLEQEK